MAMLKLAWAFRRWGTPRRRLLFLCNTPPTDAGQPRSCTAFRRPSSFQLPSSAFRVETRDSAFRGESGHGRAAATDLLSSNPLARSSSQPQRSYIATRLTLGSCSGSRCELQCHHAAPSPGSFSSVSDQAFPCRARRRRLPVQRRKKDATAMIQYLPPSICTCYKLINEMVDMKMTFACQSLHRFPDHWRIGDAYTDPCFDFGKQCYTYIYACPE